MLPREIGLHTVRQPFLIIVILLALVLAFPGVVHADDDGPPVYVVLFYSPSCGHCHAFITEDIPVLQEMYGDQLVIIGINVTVPGGNELFYAAYDYFGIPRETAGVPTLVCGDNILIGRRPQELSELIQQGIEAGGAPLPDIPGLAEAFGQFQESVAQATQQAGGTITEPPGEPTTPPTLEPTATASVTPVAATGASSGGDQASEAESEAPLVEENSETLPTIHMAYFYEPGCQECAAASINLEYVQGLHPNLQIHNFDIEEEEATLIAEWLGDRLNVPVNQRLLAPAIYAGEDYLLEGAITSEALFALVDKYGETGTQPIWEGWEADRADAEGRLIANFRSFGSLTVLGAGLIDGLNPCAFATLVFFVSYLAFTGRKGAEVLLVGAAFTLGVFVVYLLIGMGVVEAIESIGAISALGKWVYGITAALTALLAIGSLYDYLKARQGKVDEMALKLPASLRKAINAVIRKGAAAPAFAAVALVTGAAVSVIELGCTGQIYLPTIIFVMSRPELHQRALFQLIIYNVGFVVPLIVVFLLACLGTSSQRMAAFVNRHTATVKLMTALLFLALTGWLVWELLA